MTKIAALPTATKAPKGPHGGLSIFLNNFGTKPFSNVHGYQTISKLPPKVLNFVVMIQ
jgi:hypothetical protein